MNGILQSIRARFSGHGRTSSERAGDGSSSPSQVGATKGTVLIIDNDQTLLDCVRDLLRAAGFSVLTSDSGPKALNILRYASGDVRVVLLDFNMPCFNGEETLMYLRMQNPSCKIIAFTGVDAKQLPPTFRERVDSVLTKPFRSDELIQRVEHLVKSSTAQRGRS
jgi:CheY-like chemotaxis protein